MRLCSHGARLHRAAGIIGLSARTIIRWRLHGGEDQCKGPCQVWGWDITYLHSSIRGVFYYLYMIVDVWSRKIVAAEVFAEESMEHSSRLFAKICFIHDVLPGGLFCIRTMAVR